MARESAVPVGDFGDAERLVIEGAKTFSPKEIKEALSLNPEFLLAADPDGPLYNCVATTERLIRAGYRNSGFPDVVVKASADRNARAIAVSVKEGTRYRAGEIRIRGNRAIPAAQLIARLTQPYPPENVLPRSPREGRGQSGTCWVDHNGNNVELSDPLWSPGEPAAFPASVNDWKLHGDVFNALADLGFFFARFSVDVVVNPTTKKADLVIDISKEGPKSQFATVTITDNKANSRQEILKYTGFRTGLPATRDELAAVQEKLWRSGRFIKSEVTMFRPATPADGAVLSINVSELHCATPLGKPLTPEEAILLKCRDWLANCDRWGGDFVCRCDAAEGSFCLVFSPSDGAFSSIKYIRTPEQKPAEFTAIASPSETGLYDLLAKRKLVARLGHAQLVCTVTLRLDDNANEEKEGRGKLAWGLGITSRNPKFSSPLDLVLSFDPVYFLEMANRPGTKCAMENGVLTITNADMVLRLDAASGRPLECVLKEAVEEKSEEKHSNKDKQVAKSPPRESPKVLRFSVVPGEFQRRVDAVHAATARIPNTYVPQCPVSSAMRFALDYDAVWEWLGETDNRALRPVVRRMLDKNVCEPFDRVAISFFGGEGNNSSGQSDSFSIPRAPAPTAVLEQANSDNARIASLLLAVAHLAFVPGSWPDAVARDTVVMFQGYGDAAIADTKRAYRSEKSGPICLLAASVATAKRNPAIGDLMATRGLERLSLQDFRKDYAALLDPKCPSGQFFQRVAEFLRDADDSDIQSLSAILPGNAAAPFQNWARGLRQNRSRFAAEALPPLLDAAWEAGLRECVKATLQTCQSSCAGGVPDGSPDDLIANTNQALRVDPKFIRAYELRGCAYCKKCDYDSAIADYTEAIRLRPDDLLDCYRARAWLYAQKADFDNLIADCSEVIRLAPKDSEAYYFRAWAYHMKAAKNGRADGSYAKSSVEKPSNDDLVWFDCDQDKDKISSGAPVASAVTAPVYGVNASRASNNGAVPSASATPGPWGADNSDACLDNAISDYSTALRLNPKLAEAYYNRSLAYRQLAWVCRARGLLDREKADNSKADADFAEARRLGPPQR
jgi:tetratricopeptide (TPR) repeat protein